MKLGRKLIRNSLLVLFIVFGVVLLIAYMKKDRIIEEIVQTIADTYEINITYEDTDLQLFSHFPAIGIGIDQLNISMEDSISFLQADDIDVGFHLPSFIFGSTYRFTDISISNAIVQLTCDSLFCNYDRFLTDSTETERTEGSSLGEIALDRIQLQNIHLIYQNNNDEYRINDWTASLSGSYKNDVFNGRFDQEHMKLNVIQSGVSLLSNWDIRGKGKVTMNQEQGEFAANEVELLLNELPLRMNASLVNQEMPAQVDASLYWDRSNIKPILSLLPPFLQKNYEDISTSGEGQLSAEVKGALDPANDIYPKISLTASIFNGSIQYSGLPSSIHDLNALLQIKKREGPLDLLKVQLPNVALQMGQQTMLKAMGSASNLFTDARIKGKLESKADLAEIYASIPMDQVDALEGQFSTDLSFAFQSSHLAKAEYDKISLSGNLFMEQLLATPSSYPTLQLDEWTTTLSPLQTKTNLRSISAGNTDIQEMVIQTGPPSDFVSNSISDASANLMIRGRSIDINEWLSVDTTISEVNESEQNEIAYDFSKYKLKWDATIDKIFYDSYLVEKVSTKGMVNKDQITIEPTTLSYLDQYITMDGEIKDVSDYVSGKTPLTASFMIQSDNLNADVFMEESDSESNTSGSSISEPFSLPANLNMAFDYLIQKVSYGGTRFTGVNGRATLSESIVQIEPTTANSMGGKVFIEGLFSAKEGKEPYSEMQIAAEKLQFARVFEAIPSVQKIAPLFEQMEGDLNTKLSFKSILEKDLTPSVEHLSAQGFIETLSASIQNFAPLEKVSQLIGEKMNSSINLTNTKNWFEIKDGTVIVEPFTTSIAKEEWEISGQHKIGGEMNYHLSGPVSISQIKQIKGGEKLLTKVNHLIQSFPLSEQEQIDKVDLTVHITGRMQNPQTNIHLAEGAKQSVSDRISGELRTAKQTVKDSLSKLKNESVQESKRVVEETKENAKRQMKEKAREILTGKKSDTSTNTIDSLAKEAEKKASEVKKKLKKWNPFKKN